MFFELIKSDTCSFSALQTFAACLFATLNATNTDAMTQRAKIATTIVVFLIFIVKSFLLLI